jgi:hypothetical protein
MSSVSFLLIAGDVAEYKKIQAVVVAHMGVDARGGQQDCPGDEPDGKEYFYHHSEEADKTVGIHAVSLDDIAVVCVPHGEGP